MNPQGPHKPRILISYFFGKDTIPLGDSCAAGLRELGWEVCCFNSQAESRINLFFLKYINKLVHAFGFKSFDISAHSRWGNHNFRQSELERAVAAFRPDILLVIRGNSFDAETIYNIKTRYGVRKTVGWWVKDPRATTEMLEDARIYDHYFCIHQFGYGREDRINYLPALGIDRNLYHPFSACGTSKHNIVFVGGWSRRRQEMLQAIADLPLEIYGPGWRKWRRKSSLRGKVKASKIWGKDLNYLYNVSKIVLNISSWDPGRTGLNLRVLDVPATGAFLLTDASPELEHYFHPGHEIETFSSPAELREKVLFYLAHDPKREDIARNGHEKALTFEGYRDKMQRLLDVIGEPYIVTPPASTP